MEEITKMFESLPVKMSNIQTDLQEIKNGMQLQREEIISIKEDISNNKLEWKREEEEELVEKIMETEERLERLEKEKIRNNIVITGIKIDLMNKREIIKELETSVEKEIGIKVQFNKAIKLKEDSYIVELRNWEDKVEVMKKKRIFLREVLFT
ncbi:unnamed protein product [Brassicogethes aeneus]|uniref:Uncharacterized protein n=1 Tax=Brassicogethes aeneus TaxID=1431903 RepID=A0A9P0B9D7_BRAAE|nr:unnamed protein product [Brassicogethes aeneus]